MGRRQSGQRVSMLNGIWTVTARMEPHELAGGSRAVQALIGCTSKIGAAWSVPCRNTAETPASVLESDPATALTGPLTKLPKPGTNNATSCPGATVTGTGAG